MNLIYFNLSNHIYPVFYNDEIIILDLIKDQYIILQNENTDNFIVALKYPFQRSNQQYHTVDPEITLRDNFNESIAGFLEQGLIFLSNKPGQIPQLLQEKKALTGAANIDWRLEYGSLNKKASLTKTLEAYYYLLKVKYLLKFRGFDALIQALQKAVQKHQPHKIPSNEEIDELAITINRACYLFPKKVVCLPWATTFVFVALHRKLQCQLIIGVQNYPFAAHAWVEVEQRVVADDPSLPQDLAIILREPHIYV